MHYAKKEKVQEKSCTNLLMKNYAIPSAYSKKMKMAVDSDFFFNNPKKVEEMKSYGEPYPVDVMGACVPLDKSIDNLKKTEESIQERFGLKAGGEE